LRRPEDAAEYYYTSGDFVYSHAGIEAYKDAMHRAAVEYAMRKEGKTVHAVIAGYPDFSKPEGPEAELVGDRYSQPTTDLKESRVFFRSLAQADFAIAQLPSFLSDCG
jgi:hypothetical protein